MMRGIAMTDWETLYPKYLKSTESKSKRIRNQRKKLKQKAQNQRRMLKTSKGFIRRPNEDSPCLW